MATIVSKYYNKTHTGKKPLYINFDHIEQTEILLDMELVDNEVNCKVAWRLYFNNELLDYDDLTHGNKAELLLLNTYAGTSDNPTEFNVIAYNTQTGNALATLQIYLYATPTITDAEWVTLSGNTKSVAVNENFTIHFKASGLYYVPITIHVFYITEGGESVEIPEFKKEVVISDFETIEYFHAEKKIVAKNKTIPIIKDLVFNTLSATFVNVLRHNGIKATTLYFVMGHKNRLLYNSQQHGKLLNVVFNFNTFNSFVTTGLSPVKIGFDEYFTQKYEPCKYEKITFEYNNTPEVTLFNEEQPLETIEQANNFRIVTVAPPTNSANKKQIILSLTNVETGQNCSFSETNQQILAQNNPNYVAQGDTESQPHQGRVVNTEALQKNNIEVVTIVPDQKVAIKPSFNYVYDESEPLNFLKNYFLFSSLLDDDLLWKSLIKQAVMELETHYKNLKPSYKIPIQTCRYTKKLYLHTYPDVAWAFHAVYGEPQIEYYYNNNKNIVLQRGFDEELDFFIESPIFNNFFKVGFGIFSIQSVRSLMIDIIKDMANSYAFGYTAYYDFATPTQNNKQIDYAKAYPTIFKLLIGLLVSLELLVDILLIILTEGAALANFLSRAGKVAKMTNTAKKLQEVGEKAEKLQTKHKDAFKAARYGAMGNNYIKTLNGSYYNGYRFLETDTGVSTLLEQRVALTVVDINNEIDENLGEFFFKKTPLGIILNISAEASAAFDLGISRTLVESVSWSTTNPQTGQKVQGNQGKEASSWYRAGIYPLRLLSGVSKIALKIGSAVTEQIIKDVFNTEGTIKRKLSGHITLDFELKIDKANKKINVLNNQYGKVIQAANKASVSIGVASGLYYKLELTVREAQKARVTANEILTILDPTENPNNQKSKKFESDRQGRLHVQGNLFLERRYYFNTNLEVYYDDIFTFSGLAGEIVKIVKNNKVEDEEEIKKEIVVEEVTPFVLIQPYSYAITQVKLS